MAQEIERKFLVIGEYKSKAYVCHHISQGYICSESGRTVRVRIRDNEGFLTIKGPSEDGGLSRFEWEKEIPVTEAKQLMKLCNEEKIDKNRYLVKSGDHVFEVDEFFGENEGLVVAEVELKSINDTYDDPGFIGKEVTGDMRYYNSHLMKMPFCKWDK